MRIIAEKYLHATMIVMLLMRQTYTSYMKLRIGNSREIIDLGELPDWLLMLCLRAE